MFFIFRIHTLLSCLYVFINIQKYNYYRPGDSKAYQMIGDIMFKLQQWDESMFQYHRILLTRPDDSKTKYKIPKYQ